jgi:hypothetical protein
VLNSFPNKLYYYFYYKKKKKSQGRSQVWWYMPVISALRRLRQEDGEFKASLGYTAGPSLKKLNKKIKITGQQKATSGIGHWKHFF